MSDNIANADQKDPLVPEANQDGEQTMGEKVSNVFKNIIQDRIKVVKEWFMSYGVQSSLGVLCWLFGFMGMSVLWVLVGSFSIYYSVENFYKKKKTTEMLNMLTEDKMQLVEAVKALHVQHSSAIPSWIYFPDVERVEWINRIIRQLWPSIQGHFKDILSEQVGPSIRSSSGLLGNFKFTDMDLGNIPPQIVGIKVYDEHQTRSDEIILDMQLVYASQCNIGVSVNYLSAGLCDLDFRALMRVELQPLLSKSPFVGAVAVSFVHDPKIDFNLTNLANMFDIPGFDSLLRGAINDSVRGIMVYPEKYVLKLVPDVDISFLKFPLPEGVLRVHVIKAKNLLAKDKNIFGPDLSDPYVVVQVGRNFKHKTAVVSENINPEWNESFDVIIEDIWHSTINISLYDDDKFNTDDSLGTASLAVKSVFDRGVVEEWIDLTQVKKGSILMKFEWFQLSHDASDLSSAIKATGVDNENTNSSLVSIYVDKAGHLPERSKDSMASNVQLRITVPGRKDAFKTKFVDFSNSLWEERFLCPVRNPRVGQMKFEVVLKPLDEIEGDNSGGKCLGVLDYPIRELLELEGLCIDKEFPLQHSDPNSFLKLRMCLRVLKSKEKQGPAFDESEVSKQPPPQPQPTIETVPSPTISSEIDIVGKSTPELEDDEGENHTNNNRTYERSPSIASLASVVSDEAIGRMHTDESRKPADNGKGRVMLTIRCLQDTLLVLVVKAENLIICDEDHQTSDPYVKVTVIGENLSKKTKVVKKCLNPTFDQRLSFSLNEADPKKCQLKVSVKNHTGFLSTERVRMGAICINLASLSDLSLPNTQWYALE